jgi:hypothetical protein
MRETAPICSCEIARSRSRPRIGAATFLKSSRSLSRTRVPAPACSGVDAGVEVAVGQVAREPLAHLVASDRTLKEEPVHEGRRVSCSPFALSAACEAPAAPCALFDHSVDQARPWACPARACCPGCRHHPTRIMVGLAKIRLQRRSQGCRAIYGLYVRIVPTTGRRAVPWLTPQPGRWPAQNFPRV